jgi:hypothetical protein
VLQKFPDLKDALIESIEIELHAGEALFIPAFVWQRIVSHEPGEQCLLMWINLLTFIEGVSVCYYGHMHYSTLFQKQAHHLSMKMVEPELMWIAQQLPPQNVAHLLNVIEHLFVWYCCIVLLALHHQLIYN